MTDQATGFHKPARLCWLGVTGALIALSAALAGLTLALQNTQLIALTGSITGIAAALSMAASEYLSFCLL